MTNPEIDWGKGVEDPSGNIIKVDFSDAQSRQNGKEYPISTELSETEANYTIGHKELSDFIRITKHTLLGGDDRKMNDESKYYSELKEDLRESERRIAGDAKEREARIEKSLDAYAKDSKDREERYLLQAKDRDERFMKEISEIKKVVADGEKERKSNTRAMWTLAITTIIGIAGMVIAVLVSL